MNHRQQDKGCDREARSRPLALTQVRASGALAHGSGHTGGTKQPGSDYILKVERMWLKCDRIGFRACEKGEHSSLWRVRRHGLATYQAVLDMRL